MKININDNGKTLTHYWSKCVGAGRAKEGLRASWLKQLKTVVNDCGFEYIRFHGLLHDDMCVYKENRGKEIYNFQYIDDLYDSLLEIGIRPIVELSFMPSDMASDITERRQFWWQANINPPIDYEKWYRLVYELSKHLSYRYGDNEVKRWYFEVWNEPNLHNGFWSGGKTEYFKLYEYSVKAIKSVNNEFKVGGPATSNYVPDNRFSGEYDDTSKHMTHKLQSLDDGDWQPVWVREFIKYCHEKKLPVDFISVHPYPTDFALDSYGETRGRSRNSNSTTEDLKTIRKIVDESPYRDAEIFLTEWSSSPSSRDNSHDYIPAAAYVMKANIESRGLVDALAYWTFTDVFEECGAGDTPFHGGFGMINYQGIKKPVYHAYRFLNELGDIEVYKGNNYIVTKESRTNKAVIVAFNYESDTMKTAVTMTSSFESAENVMTQGKNILLSFKVNGFEPLKRFSVERVNFESGDVMKLYKELGYPDRLSIYETQLLKREADTLDTSIIFADSDGVLDMRIQMNPWEILLIKEL